jgi:hypothetical protein
LPAAPSQQVWQLIVLPTESQFVMRGLFIALIACC